MRFPIEIAITITKERSMITVFSVLFASGLVGAFWNRLGAGLQMVSMLVAAAGLGGLIMALLL